MIRRFSFVTPFNKMKNNDFDIPERKRKTEMFKNFYRATIFRLTVIVNASRVCIFKAILK